MSATLPRPGVEVIQEFRTTSPVVVTPTLVPCVVGVAKQVVEVLVTQGTGNVLNADALMDLPAAFVAKAATGSPAKYTGLNGLILAFSVNNGVAVEVTFSDPTAAGLTPTDIVTQVMARLSVLAVSSVLAELVGTTQWRLRTVGTGEFQSILITGTTASAVATAFGIGTNRSFIGLNNYNQYEVTIPVAAYPDPRGNLDELTIQTETARVLLATEAGGSGLLELKRDQAYLRSGVVDDAASRVGNVSLTGLTYPGDVQGDILNIKIDDGATQTWTIASSPANAAALLAELEANFTGCSFTQQVGTNFLVITSDTLGAASKVEVLAGTLATQLGLAVGSDTGESIAAVDDGDGNIVTPLIDFDEEDFTLTATAAVLTASLAPTTPGAGTTLLVSDGQQVQTVVFAGTESTIGAVVTAINAVVGVPAGGRLTASDSGGALRLTHSHSGDESFIKIVGGTALAALDPGGSPVLITGATARGVPFKPLPGDELYIDGVFYGNIVQVAPGGVARRLKIDKQVTISTNVGARFYIQAKNLPVGGSATRPYPDLAVDSLGNLTLKHSFLRDPFGTVIDVRAPVYVAYTAVRKDVTALAADRSLLKFESTTQLSASLEPISTANPLGLGLFFALINAPGAEVTGLGVDEISADQPLGTLEAFTRAAEFLEAFEVYALAPLTHDQLVAQVFNTHVTFMSLPENKGERIVLWNPEVPTHKLDTLVVSGTEGDALTTTTFDTKAASLTTKVNNAGVSPVGTIATSKGLYLDIAGDDRKYSISAISGSVVTIRTSFAAGENDDGYYSTSALVPANVIQETYAVRVRGAALTSGGVTDKAAVADTVAALGQSFLNRRFWMTFPDACASTIEGIEQIIDGFYMNAAIAGMIAQQPPQQSFTNFPMTGFTRVLGSNDTFSARHLDVMAAGGAYIIVQDALGAPLISRFALTTDLTSIETRTDSITKVVDFVAKFMRKGLRNYIGRFNITQGFLDSIGSVIQGLLGVLIETGVLIGAQMNNIIQDEDAPDTVLVEITLDVPFPANYIRLTLQV
jgi:hypothetical protein